MRGGGVIIFLKDLSAGDVTSFGGGVVSSPVVAFRRVRVRRSLDCVLTSAVSSCGAAETASSLAGVFLKTGVSYACGGAATVNSIKFETVLKGSRNFVATTRYLPASNVSICCGSGLYKASSGAALNPGTRTTFMGMGCTLFCPAGIAR